MRLIRSQSEFTEQLLKNRVPIMILNAQTDPQIRDHGFFVDQGLISCLLVPMATQKETVGFISFYTKEEREFDQNEIDFLTIVAGQAAIAIHNSQLFAKLRQVNIDLDREITERRRAEEQFRLVVDSAPNGILMIDKRGAIVLVNTKIEDTFGYRREELLGKPIETLVPARYRGQHPEHWEKFFDTSQTQAMGAGRDLFGLHKNESEFPIEVRLNPIETTGENLVLASVVDITERKHAQEQLRQSEEHDRTMIEKVLEYAIFMLDGEGRVVTWNGGAERIKGYRSEEIIGKHFSCFYPAEEIKGGRPEQILKTALAEGHCEDEGWRVRKDGSRFWASVALTAVRDGGGRLVGFSKVTRDLTRRRGAEEHLKAAKEAAETANQAKSSFLANISHEIRTPMSGIIGMAGLLCDTELSSKQREYCEIIRRSSDSLLTIINEVLDFSKVESGEIELEIINFELRSAVEEVMDLFAIKAEDKGIELINFIRNNVPTELQGDPGRLRQILANLVGNALKFTENGEVVVGISVLEQTFTNATLRFSVTDSGIGIPEDKVDKLFNAFTQVDASTTRKYGGTGLGLSISKKFVELMGGEIGVDSNPGKGSCFWFTLTLLKQSEGDRQIPSPRADLHGLNMLIVEANSTNRTVLEEYLSIFGTKSQSAEDGPTALELLKVSAEKGERYDLAILDFKLPGMDGLELARTIRQNPKFGAIKLLMLTSVGKRGDGKLAEQAGIDAYLTKPFRFSYLYECLALLMGKNPTKADSLRSLITSHSLAELKAKVRLRILVAEDNHINQKVTVSLLEKMGHRADVAGNGKEAIDAYKLIFYDVILMDLQMPQMDGFEATLQIRLLDRINGRETFIIAVTAHAMKEYREKCLKWGFDDYVSKPINVRQLRDAIERKLARTETTNASTYPALQSSAYEEVINFSEALAQVEGNTKLLGEITQIFLEQYPKLLEETRQALAQSDNEVVASAAHTLASSVGQLGAQRAFTAAKKLEHLGWQGDLSHVPEALAELEGELLLVRSALSNLPDLSHPSVP